MRHAYRLHYSSAQGRSVAQAPCRSFELLGRARAGGPAIDETSILRIEEEENVISYRTVGIHAPAQEILARSDYAVAAHLRRPDHPGARIGSGPFHLHFILE